MPWKKSEKNIYEKQMVECSDWIEWFHRMCERIPDTVSQNKIQNAIGCVISTYQEELKLCV